MFTVQKQTAIPESLRECTDKIQAQFIRPCKVPLGISAIIVNIISKYPRTYLPSQSMENFRKISACGPSISASQNTRQFFNEQPRFEFNRLLKVASLSLSLLTPARYLFKQTA